VLPQARDGLPDSGGVDLADAQQRARGEDDRVRQPAAGCLRRWATAICSTSATCAAKTFITALMG